MPELSPARWPHVEALLDRALDLPPEERTAFLERTRAANPDLLREVREVLRAGDRARALLEDSGLLLRWNEEAVPFAEESDESDENLAGTAVGRYRLLEEIGRGGMGTVYRAERADGAFEQTAALKLVRRGMDSDAVLRRFHHERQVLAALDHPNVARLLDGGRSEEGRPYFVMELVEGEPITAYCDRRRLGVEARLRLFLQVCEAVAFAHRNLVVHRDLKPSNVLVTDDERGRPQAKLLDFGIAKLLSADTVPGATLTQPGHLLLTPQYAAPEQIRGEAVTTATDVYALGVLLYELLTGQPPYRLGSSSPAELERVIGGVEPPRPSAAVAPGEEAEARGVSAERLKKRLAGDLDQVCLKALRKEPERRYASAEALGEDVERHLAGLPVTARPDTVGYRARTFVRRHRAPVVATAAVVVVFLALVGFYTVRLAAERDRAQQEAATAEQVTALLAGIFRGSDPSNTAKGERSGLDVTAQELLDRGARRIEELEGEPLVQAELTNVIGRVYRELGLYEEAQTFLERALAMRRRLLGENHPDVATSMNGLAIVLFDRGAYDEAEQLYRETLAMRRRLLGENHPDVAISMSNLAVHLHDTGRYDAYDEAESLLREALATQRQLLGEDHPDVATALNDLAFLLKARGAYEEAEPLLREALAMAIRLRGQEHFYVAISLVNLGRLLIDTGRVEEAEPLLRQALDTYIRVLGKQDIRTIRGQVTFGTVLTALGRYDEAEARLQEAHTLYQSDDSEVKPEDREAAREALVALYTAWGKPEQAARYR